jgi:hypothetical protein
MDFTTKLKELYAKDGLFGGRTSSPEEFLEEWFALAKEVKSKDDAKRFAVCAVNVAQSEGVGFLRIKSWSDMALAVIDRHEALDEKTWRSTFAMLPYGTSSRLDWLCKGKKEWFENRYYDDDVDRRCKSCDRDFFYAAEKVGAKFNFKKDNLNMHYAIATDGFVKSIIHCGWNPLEDGYESCANFMLQKEHGKNIKNIFKEHAQKNKKIKWFETLMSHYEVEKLLFDGYTDEAFELTIAKNDLYDGDKEKVRRRFYVHIGKNGIATMPLKLKEKINTVSGRKEEVECLLEMLNSNIFEVSASANAVISSIYKDMDRNDEIGFAIYAIENFVSSIDERYGHPAGSTRPKIADKLDELNAVSYHKYLISHETYKDKLKRRLNNIDPKIWEEMMSCLEKISLSCGVNKNKVKHKKSI